MTTTEKGTLGCDYQGHEFGAPYPDSVCVDGYLWDADSGDAAPNGEGWIYDHGGDLPCPKCNKAEYDADRAERLEDRQQEDAENVRDSDLKEYYP